MVLLKSVFNHLVLPPELPGRQDPENDKIADSILTRLICACDTLTKLSGQTDWETLGPLRRSLGICQNAGPGRVDKASLLNSFFHLGLDERLLLIIHVSEQNAAILVRRQIKHGGSDTVIFEAFEASPRSKDVLAADNALLWDFPGRAAEIPLNEFLERSFQLRLAEFLEQATTESLSRFTAISVKANISVTEIRDTTNPALISQFLMPLLEALGSSPCVPILRKRVRDDVHIQDAKLPWRRLPFWLVLRVATQRQLCLALDGEAGRAYYKFLICTVLAQLLEDCVGKLEPELVIMLRNKLCRRLAKLDVEKAEATSHAAVYEALFTSTGVWFAEIVRKATTHVEREWENFRRMTLRPVPRLPRQADQSSLCLSLPNSGNHLDNLLRQHPLPRSTFTSSPLDEIVGDDIAEKVKCFTNRYFGLAKMERVNEEYSRPVPLAVNDCQVRCLTFAGVIQDLFAAVGSAYDSSPEQLSIYILNLFDMWARMDECAVRACPLLLDHHPVFDPELLDALQLSSLSAMVRLQRIQAYLRDRCTRCGPRHESILALRAEDCFAVRYLKQSPELQQLERQIEEDSRKSRESKELEWKKACNQYDSLSLKILRGTCVCSSNSDGSRSSTGCMRCRRLRSQKSLTIGIHEDFLPADSIQRGAVLFELGIPSYLAAYRAATWRILRDLAHPSKPRVSRKPILLLGDWKQLRDYTKTSSYGITLASVKKAFTQTHFRRAKLKVELPAILLPLGAKFSLYDAGSGTWVDDLDKPLTLQHLCGIRVPHGLKAAVLPQSEHPPPSIEGPSSYEILANQTECPHDMSIHEFTAYQKLIAAKALRWPVILIELGSSNLKFSCEDTMHLLCDLAIQAGPQGNADHLRTIHSVFQDKLFCRRLVEQIRKRLNAIIPSWREHHCMEILITLSLRLFYLASETDSRSGGVLLEIARKATLAWVSRLRDEVRNTIDPKEAETAATFGFQAALLCRRTFSAFVGSSTIIDEENLTSFLQVSIGLQETLVVDLATLPQTVRNMLIRDTKMAFELEPLIRESIRAHPGSLEAVVSKFLSGSISSPGRTFTPWQLLNSPNERWVRTTMTTTTSEFTYQQVVHVNFVVGHVLVDGKPLRRLPHSIRDSPDVQELFGDRHLLTYSSSLRDMSHTVTTRFYGHEIHFGHRGGEVVIRAFTRNGLLEFIPRRLFLKNGFDLPSTLVENCVHWLNYQSHCVEIRRKPKIWKTRMGDWILDVPRRKAMRRGTVSLVDPYSQVFRSVAGLFCHFEAPECLTVFQPPRGALAVELRRLELSFFVNRNFLLQCRELNAEIDPNQDPGTLYGLQSKIVLRDVDNPTRRSIIVPLGRPTWIRHGIHVAVRTCDANDYGRFDIDNLLGRLSCPPEPRLLYSKALFHALTSFALPDSLTGRTGVEESSHIIRSGSAQPWIPLGLVPGSILEDLGRLSPSRVYYPKDKRRLQTVTWDKFLTTSIQHDCFEFLVQEILTKSNRLAAFSPSSKYVFEVKGISHLRRRGHIRRLLYERRSSEPDGLDVRRHTTYNSRDRTLVLPQATYVFQIARLLCTRPFRFQVKKDLRTMLRDWGVIGGFCATNQIEPTSLGNLMECSIKEQWGNLVDFCRHTEDRHELIFRLCLLAFGSNPEIEMIKVLAAFGSVDELKTSKTPTSPLFLDFSEHQFPTSEALQACIAPAQIAFKSQARLPKGRQDIKTREDHQRLCEIESSRLAALVLDQWPSPCPSAAGFTSSAIDVDLAMSRIMPQWEQMSANYAVSQYIDEIQRILDRHKGNETSMSASSQTQRPIFWVQSQSSIVPCLSWDLLTDCGTLNENISGLAPRRLTAKHFSDHNPAAGSRPSAHRPGRSRETIELRNILKSFSCIQNALWQEYGNDLIKSLDALEEVRSQSVLEDMTSPSAEFLREKIVRVRKELDSLFTSIELSFSGHDGCSQWLRLGGLWPCITPSTLLELLRFGDGHQIGGSTRKALVYYGVLVTQLQQHMRTYHATIKRDERKAREEWGHTGHENWEPLDFPDWLLLEIDGNLLIRREQVEVAQAIISPVSNLNSVLQMNMGQGKTACIVPMAMALLANKKDLARLIVPKALLPQTAQTIQARLGGLVGREVRHIPFSRRTPTTADSLKLYSDLHNEILDGRGVILTSPEHILSYKLSGLQRLVDTKFGEAHKMMKFQSQLNSTCRDVLDESDISLSVQTQLIYPSGVPMHVDGHPIRWEVTQTLLSLVQDRLPSLRRRFPRSIEVIGRPRGFPIVHFLKPDVEDELRRQLLECVCNGLIPHLRIPDSTSAASQTCIINAISRENLAWEEIQGAFCSLSDQELGPKCLLLIRGLLVNRVLLHCLKKRWNVQYGLHPKRPPVAVPFEGKGVPSEQAEFGHADVAIILTCLAFYYSGLSIDQFREGLQYVLMSDDPASEYDKWTHGCDALPKTLHHWNSINLEDKGQVEELWKNLRLHKTVLDYYMNRFVFPVYAKQFRNKLQASGWDLPLVSKPQCGCDQLARTTGFSGTNDSKMMLPLTIRQDDLPSLLQTNAEVLTYLLQDRNRSYLRASRLNRRMTEEELLRKLEEMSIRVFIDAGAYVLEMDNRSLAKKWLEIDTTAKAAVFFEADNRAWVQYRAGKETPLLATRFSDDLDQCVVYLDEAHTRGTDLKLPTNARGALTLALGQTKDKTVQAAMRLRQLATTQSVTFFAPPEVHQSIMDVCDVKGREATITSAHVVRWLLEQTCRANEQLQSLYLAQGYDFCRRINAQWKYPDLITKKSHRKSLVKAIRHSDPHTLEQLYGRVTESQQKSSSIMSFRNLIAFTKNLDEQRNAMGAKWRVAQGSIMDEVEQEQEVEFHVEKVRQVQRPPKFQALSFPGVHPSILDFAATGNLCGNEGYIQVFDALRATQTGQKHALYGSSSRLFVSVEFTRTVNEPNDNFLRPVEWILWSPLSQTAVIIIPEEAENLIHFIRDKGKLSRVHLIAYAAPVTRSMIHFSNLLYYTTPPLPTGHDIPSWLPIEIGILAGRLYLDFGECRLLKEYLGVPLDADDLDQAKGHAACDFGKNPMGFLLEWLALRRKTQDFLQTPMGYICQSRPLHKDHPFFAETNAESWPADGLCATIKDSTEDMEGSEDGQSNTDNEWQLDDEIA